LKAFYAGASADALRFVLAPTAALAALLADVRFDWEAGAGYLCRAPAYLIAPACAGLNFTIAAFASLLLAFTASLGPARAKAAWLVVAAILALAATPVVGAVRIALDLALRDAALPLDVARGDLHRVLGVVASLSGLAGLHVAVERGLEGHATTRGRSATPVAAYLAVTVGVPLLNGAASRPGSVRHFLVVIATAGVIAGGVRLLSVLGSGPAVRRAAGDRA
jgi:exosortase K